MLMTVSPDLKPGVKRRLKELQRLARREKTFMALVDMYRNVTHEPDVAAHYMAWHDWERGHVDGVFQAWACGYDPKELEFLANRGVPGSRPQKA